MNKNWKQRLESDLQGGWAQNCLKLGATESCGRSRTHGRVASPVFVLQGNPDIVTQFDPSRIVTIGGLSLYLGGNPMQQKNGSSIVCHYTRVSLYHKKARQLARKGQTLNRLHKD